MEIKFVIALDIGSDCSKGGQGLSWVLSALACGMTVSTYPVGDQHGFGSGPSGVVLGSPLQAIPF
jgi:hypothetical protein